MPAVAAGAAIVGAGISIYGAIKSANDQAEQDALREKAAYDQSDELNYREGINKVLRDEAAYKAELDIGSYSQGHAGTNIGSQLEIKRQTDLQNALSRREIDFQMRQLREGGRLYGLSGQNAIEAGNWQAAGTGASLLGNFASKPYNQPNTGRSEKLPSFTGG